MEKKSFVILLLSILSFGFVRAQDLGDSLSRGSSGIVNIAVSAFGPFFAALLGGSPEYLFEQIMLFFIIISIVYMVIRTMPLFKGNGRIIFIVTMSVSLLSTRFFMISDFLIETVLLPYSVLGVTLTAFLPLIIGFFFIHQFPEGFLRKAFWIFFIVVFFAMWDLRYSEVGGISWIYFWSAIISLLFFLFDGTIRRAMLREKQNKVNLEAQEKHAAHLRKRLRELARDKEDWSPDAYEREKRKITKDLARVFKY